MRSLPIPRVRILGVVRRGADNIAGTASCHRLRGVHESYVPRLVRPILLALSVALASLTAAPAGAATWYVRTAASGGPNTTGPANSCATSDVASAHSNVANNPANPDTIQLAALSCTWTSGVTFTKSVIVKGAGDGSTERPCPCTIIADNASGTLVQWNISVGGTVRLSGISFTNGGGTSSADAIVINGSAGTAQWVRLDHLTFNQTNSRPHQLLVVNAVGVADHVTCTLTNSYCFKVIHPGWNGGSQGDGSFAAATSLGTTNAFYVEDTTYSGGFTSSSFVDGDTGARIVARKNTLTNSNQVVHEQSAVYGRGTRLVEFYSNTLNYTSSWGSSISFRSGTGVVFNNTNNYSAGSGGPYVAFNLLRQVSSNWDSWGGCDGTAAFDLNDTTGGPGGNGIYASSATLGTAVSGSGNLTLKVSGTPWTTNQWAPAGGTAYSARNLSQTWRTGFKLSSIITSNDANTLNLQTSSSHGDASFNVGDQWEIRRAVSCIDQVGRGQSNSLTASVGWPNQALEPIYVFNNTPAIWTYGEAGMPGFRIRLQPNLDWYSTNASCAGSSSCTTGVAVGTKAQMNAITTCTQGVGFWVTNEANWDTTLSPNTSGQLYKCGASNTWTLFYTPYTYPHPLRTSGVLADDGVPASSGVTGPAGPLQAPTNLKIQ